MPIITHVLLYLGYLTISLTVALLLNEVGGQDLGSSFLGGIALFCACAVTHSSISATTAAGRVGNTEKSMKRDMERLRVAHREVTADIDAMQTRLDSMEASIAYGTPAPTTHQIETQPANIELRMIDQIVDKLGAAMDARLQTIQGAGNITAINPTAARGPMDLVREALMENRVELYLQPIVQLPQRKTAFYEGFTRLKDMNGRIILPQEFIPAAEQAGLMSTIDNVLLFRCVQIVRKLMKQDRRIGIFCNISPSALADEQFFPQFLDFMRENRDLAGSVIFEIPQDGYENRTSIEARAMAKMVDLGFRFSIDRVTNTEMDLPDLERSGVRYVKISATTISEQIVTRGMRPRSAITREIAAADIAAVFQRYGIDMIAERIESEDTVLEVLDLDIPFGQGHLFGTPRAIKESLMEETAPPREFYMKQSGRIA
ncbi:EAL domain-containing protein [Terricaulis silvestris]|uniref:Cyclic di-GMP phosphodiesterase YfgF n=1 Tax=Terricaulis silvestris TaxID=2686094 RepID=A0A6I6MIS2_9CAUL|nr:EAL domain-containing protein [Terricaulis silvestris]QGZ94469.1 Cyclic di-GMP phosphodiesterase YfgF [Terricaulis silvestris]